MLVLHPRTEGIYCVASPLVAEQSSAADVAVGWAMLVGCAEGQVWRY